MTCAHSILVDKGYNLVGQVALIQHLLRSAVYYLSAIIGQYVASCVLKVKTLGHRHNAIGGTA